MSLFCSNRQEISKHIAVGEALCLFSGAQSIKTADELNHFSVNRNFYYLTGIDLPGIGLLIARTGLDSWLERLYIPHPDPQKARWVGSTPSAEDFIRIGQIKDVKFSSDFRADLSQILSSADRPTLWLDLEFNSTAATPESTNWIIDTESAPARHLSQQLSALNPQLIFKNIRRRIYKCRAIKRPEEIDRIRRAIALTAQGLEATRELIKPGCYEYQLAGRFRGCLLENATDEAFATICASGANAATLHYTAHNCALKAGEMVLFDLGAESEYYSADVSRTYQIPSQSKPSKIFSRCYQVVAETQQAVISAVKPGITTAELNQLTSNELDRRARQLKILKSTDKIEDYYFHKVSHSLGLNTHDPGLSTRTPLEPGMVITIEPGFYHRAAGVGIRIEDDILVTASGHENLSAAIPYQL